MLDSAIKLGKIELALGQKKCQKGGFYGVIKKRHDLKIHR